MYTASPPLVGKAKRKSAVPVIGKQPPPYGIPPGITAMDSITQVSVFVKYENKKAERIDLSALPFT